MRRYSLHSDSDSRPSNSQDATASLCAAGRPDIAARLHVSPRSQCGKHGILARETSATALAMSCHVAAPLATPARAATPRSARESPGFDPLLASSAPDAPGLLRNPQRDGHGSRGASRRRIGPAHACAPCGPAGALLRLCRRAVRIGQLRMSRANVDRTEPAWSWFKQPYHYES